VFSLEGRKSQALASDKRVRQKEGRSVHSSEVPIGLISLSFVNVGGQLLGFVKVELVLELDGEVGSADGDFLFQAGLIKEKGNLLSSWHDIEWLHILILIELTQKLIV